ncbi:hypothetical protein AGMMS49944_01360 [Spirochaetia bacterium]|nr:hypothetical protein AGMMS49944_01360 [Spirochaetia bacterium]
MKKGVNTEDTEVSQEGTEEEKNEENRDFRHFFPLCVLCVPPSVFSYVKCQGEIELFSIFSWP